MHVRFLAYRSALLSFQQARCLLVGIITTQGSLSIASRRKVNAKYCGKLDSRSFSLTKSVDLPGRHVWLIEVRKSPILNTHVPEAESIRKPVSLVASLWLPTTQQASKSINRTHNLTSSRERGAV